MVNVAQHPAEHQALLKVQYRIVGVLRGRFIMKLQQQTGYYLDSYKKGSHTPKAEGEVELQR
ncbi:MAG: hypothetical protein U5L72_12345 [Bacteroidales bacterium]|nr:hypothetical protein [Bacteroidales bacterium]